MALPFFVAEEKITTGSGGRGRELSTDWKPMLPALPQKTIL
jgi:hypothetical protein